MSNYGYFQLKDHSMIFINTVVTFKNAQRIFLTRYYMHFILLFEELDKEKKCSSICSKFNLLPATLEGNKIMKYSSTTNF